MKPLTKEDLKDIADGFIEFGVDSMEIKPSFNGYAVSLHGIHFMDVYEDRLEMYQYKNIDEAFREVIFENLIFCASCKLHTMSKKITCN